ncbi:MAG TPA: ATP-binding protein [Thermoanaerobaculia bacterium]|nr:ATP-binding protein [Thermoanaerobaculia bacterium]
MQRIRDRLHGDVKENPLSKPVTAPETPPPAKPVFGEAIRAAAVMSRFRFDQLDAPQSEIAELRASSVPVPDPSGESHTLVPAVRNAVLAHLGRDDLKALVTQHAQENDPLQNAIGVALRGIEASALSGLSSAELYALKQFHAGISISAGALPLREIIDQRLMLARLLDPLRHMTRTFSGREAELQKLRDYVGVLPPSGALGGVTRMITSLFTSTQKGPFFIHGIGGIGKTTLVARFILEHALAASVQHFPFAYLDFNRADVLADEPASLLVEAVRQIGLQYDSAYEASQALHSRWTRTLRAAAATRGSPGDTLVEDFIRFLETLGVREGPVLFVLDTFEEVQLRSTAYAQSVIAFVHALTSRIPRLRVVIAGRVPVPGIELAGNMALTEFDRAAAVGYLVGRGLDPQSATAIAAQVGGTPLSLNLAFDLFERQPADLKALKTAALFSRVKDEVIQAQLFDRILLHIADLDVRKLAYPGLILRRITPAIIRQVLAEPCGVSVPDDARAAELFERLGKQIPLVTLVEEGVLACRPDVRRLMLATKGPAEAAEIHRRAVEYYAQRADVVSRAEEIYHRLALAQPRAAIASRMIDGLEPYLVPSIDELPLAQQAVLAQLLRLQATPEALTATDDETWEHLASKSVAELMQTGDWKGAAAIVSQRTARSGTTDLSVMEVRLYDRMERYEDALKAAEVGAAAYAKTEPPNHFQLAALQIAEASVRRRLGDHAVALVRLAQAESNTTTDDDLTHVRILYERLEIAPQISDDVRLLRAQLVGRSEKVQDAQWALDLGLLRDVAAQIGNSYPPILERAVRLGALELRRSDEDAIGVVFEHLGIVVAESVGQVLGEVLLRSEVPLPVRDALTAILRRGLAPVRSRDTSRGSKHSRLDNVKKQQFQELLAGLYPNDELGSFVESRLERSLESLTFATEVEAKAADLIRIAETEGWLDTLIAAVLQSNFDNASTLQFADAIGAGLTLPAKRDELQAFVTEYRADLGALEIRTCTIESGGRVMGCGLLIAPDVVLTHESVAGPEPHCNFDLLASGGDVLHPGQLRPATVLTREHGFALLELDRPIAWDPIDPERGDPYARKRGVVKLTERRRWPRGGDRLFWLWRDGKRTHIIDTVAEEPKRIDGYVTLKTASEPAAAGSAVMDASMNIIALHYGRHPTDANASIIMPIALLVERLDETGWSHLLFDGMSE